MKYKWRGAVIDSPFENIENIEELKCTISRETKIPIDRLTILGIKTEDGSALRDSTFIRDCVIPASGFTVMGTPSCEQLDEQQQVDDDEGGSCNLDSYNSKENNILCSQLWEDDHVKRRFRRTLKSMEIIWLRPPEPSKKLLVLDLDYTIFDCKNLRDSITPDVSRIRPFLKHMFDILSPLYEYAIWSQTKSQWVEFKCAEIGMYSSEKVKPCFTLDKTSMFVVPSERKKEVKCLKLIWEKCDGLWNESNTLHVDDLARNFILNPKNGIKINPYKRNLHGGDKDLLRLSKYLLHVATLTDVRDLDHSSWKDHPSATL